MTTWLSADWHLGHTGLVEKGYRKGFATIEEMNAQIISNLQVIQPTDDLWVVGDAFMGKEPRITIPAWMAQIPGRKHLISGNHDRSFPGHKGWKPWKQWLIDVAGFTHVFDHHVKMAVGGHLVTLCHFPYEGDHTIEERYTDVRPGDVGDWLLHGHVHDAWLQRGKQINVGVDVWDMKPVSMDTLVDMMAQRSSSHD